MHKISLSSQAIEDMVYFAKGHSKLLAKIATLLESISKTPFEGIGKPQNCPCWWFGYRLLCRFQS